jgi:Membrane carboxypeptidase/penicillin-binding protein
VRCVGPSGCQGGGGTITMQVVRGNLLTPEQTIVRKIKEILLALEVEGKVEKEERFELDVNRMNLGNCGDGREAAANTYPNKN